MKNFPILFFLCLALLLFGEKSNAQVTFRIQKLTNGSYKASMKSVTAYSGSAAQISSSFQFTVLAPTGSGAVQNLTKLVGTSNFGFTRTNAPSNNPSKDYIFFNLSSTTQFDIAANTEIDLFTFDIAGTCLGNLDLFVNGTTLSPSGLNAGNNISIASAGPGNQYTGNYGGAAPCVATNPDITLSLTAPSTATVNTNFDYVYTATNVGNANTSGEITLTTTLSAGLSYQSGTGTGWTCTASGQVSSGQSVSCKSSNVLTTTSPGNTNVITITVKSPTTTGSFTGTGSIVGGGDSSPTSSNSVTTTTGCGISAGTLTRQ